MKNADHNFPESKLVSSDCLFLSDRLSKNVQFNIMGNPEILQILTFEYI